MKKKKELISKLNSIDRASVQMNFKLLNIHNNVIKTCKVLKEGHVSEEEPEKGHHMAYWNSVIIIYD